MGTSSTSPWRMMDGVSTGLRGMAVLLRMDRKRNLDPVGDRVCRHPIATAFFGRRALSNYICDTIQAMKTATIPPVRIDPNFRKEIEESLVGEESLAALVETAVRNEVARRRMQSEFVRRGITAIQDTLAAGNAVAADVVLARLEGKLAAARQRTRPA